MIVAGRGRQKGEDNPPLPVASNSNVNGWKVNDRTQLLIAAAIGETASALDHARSGAEEVPDETVERLLRQLSMFSELWPGSVTEVDRVVAEARAFATERIGQLNELLSDE
jgi:hypothetical protein